MKKYLYIFLTFLILCLTTQNINALSVSAQSAVMLETESNNVIYEKDAYTKRGMASTTKIMTALVAIENCPLDKLVKVSDKAIGVEGSSIYLKAGEALTMEQLLYALMLQSANDAATAIAIEISGSTDAFADLMNKKAEEMGLHNTHFTNPHGLYDDNHYTTAYDLAIIASNALKNETFKKIVSTKSIKIPLNQNEGTRVLVNHNKMLKSYDGAIGIKTGFTKKCGRCLVSAAERDGVTLVCVTLNAPSDWNDHTKLLDNGFEKIKCDTIAEAGSLSYTVPVVGGTESYVSVINKEELKFIHEKDNVNIKSEIILDRFLFAPVYENDVLGQVVFYNNNIEIGRVNLISQNNVEKKQVKKKFPYIFRS